MNRSTLRSLSIAVAMALSSAAFAVADEPKPVDTTDVIIPATPSIPFTGMEEPRPGYFMIGDKLAGAARTERAAFLGVGAIGVDPTVRAQLELPKGIGLTISYVEKDSPADKAGLQQHDILQKLNDQLLINAPQLATLVRTFKAGDEVTLTVLRKGKTLDLKATLIERDLPPLAEASGPFTVNFAPEPARIQDGNIVVPDYAPRLERSRTWIREFGDSKPRIIHLSPDSTRIVSRDDGTHSIQISQRGDQTTLTVKDASGKTLFDGPYNTPEEREKLPAELREKVQKMQEGIDIKTTTPTTNPSEPKAAADESLDLQYMRRTGLAT